jgi:nitroreductase
MAASNQIVKKYKIGPNVKGVEITMNEVLKAMKERRSIRKFKPDMPDRKDIDLILEAGLYAPTGKGKQDVITIAVTDKETRDRLSDDNRKIGGWPEGFDPFYGAPVIIIVLADKNHMTHVYDGSLVMGNLMLAAHSLGLGSIWIHRAKEEFEMPEYKQMLKDLGIEGEWEGIGHCAVGYADCENPVPAERKPGRMFYI